MKRIQSHPRCQVCKHEERWRIELLKAGGASLDSLAAKFKVDKDAIWRHWHRHVTDEMKAGYLAGPVQLQDLAAKASDVGTSVLDHLNGIRVVLWAHLSTATEAGDGRLAAHIAGKLTATLETIARISGELGDLARNTININTINSVAVLAEHPAFAQLQATVLRALSPHPEARADVVAALRGLDAGRAPARQATSGSGPLLELEANP